MSSVRGTHDRNQQPAGDTKMYETLWRKMAVAESNNYGEHRARSQTNRNPEGQNTSENKNRFNRFA